MKIIGITGGIGSGKSVVCDIFKSFGVPVFHADDEAKKLYDLPQVREEVNALLKDDFFPEGRLDAQKLAGVVFHNPDKLQMLNALIHPKVRQRFAEWKKSLGAVPYVIREAAILFESGADADCDEVLLVTAPESLRIKRVVERDGSNPDMVKARMQRQWSEEKKQSLADKVLMNDENRPLLPACWEWHLEWAGLSARE